jgi:hypothetical protein
MKFKYLNIYNIILILICILLLVSTFYFFNQNKALKLVQKSNAMTAVSLAGNLANIYNLTEPPNQILSQTSRQEVNTIFSTLMLIFITNETHIEDFNAIAFESLCSLIFNADKLFPVSTSTNAENQIHSLLNFKLHQIENNVKIESKSRSLSVGDQHKCALKQ